MCPHQPATAVTVLVLLLDSQPAPVLPTPGVLPESEAAALMGVAAGTESKSWGTLIYRCGFHSAGPQRLLLENT